ncbi:unnamed protein product [Paramecium sonneborni]|uniref:Uncharacterized protein n=1 Tax=Paramecium sonneborni TaxID=65129 RepID=A0A8S1NNX5_9CILI|nr:unnamed protein product [Paramecium sonneborni]
MMQNNDKLLFRLQVHISIEYIRFSVERKVQLEIQIQEQKDTIKDALSQIEFYTLNSKIIKNNLFINKYVLLTNYKSIKNKLCKR